MKEKEIPLTLERMSEERDAELFIRSKIEILSILHMIAERSTRVALYFNEGKSVVLTMVLGADEKGVWVDATPNPTDNRNVLNSQQLFCVSTHNQAKVQFASGSATQVVYGDNLAYYLPLPDKMLRLQRRDYFRLVTPVVNPLKCIAHPHPSKPQITQAYTVFDISVGGVGLLCKPEETELILGGTYRDCQIELPEVGTITVTLQIKNSYEVMDRKGNSTRRMGCMFINPDGKATMQLQRYVALMQRQAAASMTGQ